MDRFGHLAQRLFNVPLMIHPRKAEVVLAALSDRIGLVRPIHVAPAMFYGDDDDADFGAPTRTVRADDGYDMVGPVAHISVSGTLVQKLGTLRPYSGMTGYDGIRQAFLTALEDDDVESIMFEIDSPGGEVSGCFDLGDLIYSARGRKPIAAILSEHAYSAAYLLASSVDPGRIYVPRTGGTGSIGVIFMRVDMSKAIKAGGIDVNVFTKGLRKADGHPEVPMTDEERAATQSEIDYIGAIFDETVARNRGLAVSKVTGLEAGCFIGGRGVERGLADAVMAPDEAFRALLAATA